VNKVRYKPASGQTLENTIETLLADGQYLDHPLREALAKLWEHTRDQVNRLERITRISDNYQDMAQEKAKSLLDRHNRQLRQLEKITRISDRYQLMLQDLNAELKQKSTHDYLTGLANRRFILEHLKEADQRSLSLDDPYCVALIDADHFKNVNDRYGHEVGDHTLILLAKTLRESLDAADVCSRWGGEEFLALMPGVSIEAARLKAGRILDQVRQLELDAGGVQLRITVSIGLAEHHSGESYPSTVHRADLGLLDAKQRGRDCYVEIL
jgi:diguanylate cyclase (GGDEF)-like protein